MKHVIRQLIESLRYHNDDGHVNVAGKVNLRSFYLYPDYFN